MSNANDFACEAPLFRSVVNSKGRFVDTFLLPFFHSPPYAFPMFLQQRKARNSPEPHDSVVLGCGLAQSSAKGRGVGTPLSMFDPGTLLPDEEQGQRTYYISLYSEGIRLILHLIGSE